MCQAQKVGDEYRILAAVMYELPVNLEPEKLDNVIINAIKKMLKSDRFVTKDVAVSIGGGQVLVRKFLIPALPDNEVVEAVKLEAAQVTFVPLDTMKIDCQVLGKPDGKKIEVLFIGAPKQLVERQKEIVKAANLNLAIVDVDNLALANSLFAVAPECKKQSVLLLNVGHSQTNIIVLDRGNLGFSKNTNFGGKNITAEVQKQLKITYEKAESIKEQPPLWSKNALDMRSVLKNSTADLVEAVYRAIEYCTTQKIVKSVDKILMTGGTANMEGLDMLLSEALHMRVNRWQSLLRLEGKWNRELASFISIAFGLALREK